MDHLGQEISDTKRAPSSETTVNQQWPFRGVAHAYMETNLEAAIKTVIESSCLPRQAGF